MTERFDRIVQEVNELLASVEVRARKEYDHLPERVEHMRTRMRELKDAGDSAWHELRPGLERSWSELRESMDRARAQLRRKD